MAVSYRSILLLLAAGAVQAVLRYYCGWSRVPRVKLVLLALYERYCDTISVAQ